MSVPVTPIVRLRNSDILAALRDRIVSGEFAPGSRLPTRDEMEVQFGASRVTIQRALDRLIQEQFIQTEGRRGTFVVEHPPHLCRFGLVFPGHPEDDEHWSRFWTALTSEARSLERRFPVEIPVYYGVNGHTDSEDYQQLLREVRARRLAGLIFGTHPKLLSQTELLQECRVPAVALTSPNQPAPMPAVYPDRISFLERALAHFASLGRKRVAFILRVGFGHEELLLAAISKHGLVTEPFWVQRANIFTPETTRELAHLLFSGEPTSRPDALLIADDNFVEHATGGLVAAGASVPQDVEVVAHCNFPWPTPSVLPVRRLGFNSNQILSSCLDVLGRLRQGESLPPYQQIPAIFEDELAGLQAPHALPHSLQLTIP